MSDIRTLRSSNSVLLTSTSPPQLLSVCVPRGPAVLVRSWVCVHGGEWVWKCVHGSVCVGVYMLHACVGMCWVCVLFENANLVHRQPTLYIPYL